MKFKALILFIFITIKSCSGQLPDRKNNDLNEPNFHQIISEYAISLGSDNQILRINKTLDGNFLILLRVKPVIGTETEKNYGVNYFLKISPKGDTIYKKRIAFDNSLSDYLDLKDFIYAVTTDIKTMGGYTIDYLQKYDKNWKLLWSKKIDKPKCPVISTVLALNTDNEILLIANELIPNITSIERFGISFKRFNLNGKLISEKFMPTKGISNPISIIKSTDQNYYLTVDQYDRISEVNSLWLMKLNQKGDTIWTKKHSSFYSKKTILTSNGDLIFYGSYYSPEKEQEIYYHYLKIIVLDNNGNFKWGKDIKQNYYESPGDVIETKTGKYLFSSSITPKRNKGEIAYLFELNTNGDMSFELKFDYSLGRNSVPFLIRTDGQITMVGQKWIGEFGDPFHDIILVTKLKE